MTTEDQPSFWLVGCKKVFLDLWLMLSEIHLLTLKSTIEKKTLSVGKILEMLDIGHISFLNRTLEVPISIQILWTDLHNFPSRTSWESLLKNQTIFPFVTILVMLVTFSVDCEFTLEEQNWCWSLKGLTKFLNLSTSTTKKRIRHYFKGLL